MRGKVEMPQEAQITKPFKSTFCVFCAFWCGNSAVELKLCDEIAQIATHRWKFPALSSLKTKWQLI
jgi:hypothetical protein